MPGVMVAVTGNVFVETGALSCVIVGFMICGDWVAGLCDNPVTVESGVEKDAIADWIIFGVVVLAGV